MVTSEELVDQQDYEEILEDIKEEVCIDTFRFDPCADRILS